MIVSSGTQAERSTERKEKESERSRSPEIASAKEHVYERAKEHGVPRRKHAFALELDGSCPVAHRSLWILDSGQSLGSS